MAGAGFYYNNFMNRETVVSVTSTFNPSRIPYLNDRDPISYYISTEEDLDTEQTEITYESYEAGVLTEKYVDSVIVMDHNFGQFYVYTWDSGLSDWVSQLFISNFIVKGVFTFAIPILTSRVKLVAVQTSPNNVAKTISAFWVGLSAFLPAKDLVEYKPTSRISHQEIKLADGSTDKSFVKWNLDKSEKWEATLKFQYLSTAQLQYLKNLKADDETIIFIPEVTVDPVSGNIVVLSEWYVAQWVGPLSYRYSSSYKGAGYSVDMVLKEQ